MKIYDAKIGYKFNKLTLIKIGIDRAKSTRKWRNEFLCDCGNVIRWIPCFVYRNEKKDCGCVHKSKQLESAMIIKIKGYKQGLTNKVRNRYIKWQLTNEEAFLLFQSPCYYCGGFSKNEHNLNGIDRLENNRGYTITNSVPCCKFCNLAKHENSLKLFLNKIRKIYKHLNLAESYDIIGLAREV